MACHYLVILNSGFSEHFGNFVKFFHNLPPLHIVFSVPGSSGSTTTAGSRAFKAPISLLMADSWSSTDDGTAEGSNLVIKVRGNLTIRGTQPQPHFHKKSKEERFQKSAQSRLASR